MAAASADGVVGQITARAARDLNYPFSIVNCALRAFTPSASRASRRRLLGGDLRVAESDEHSE